MSERSHVIPWGRAIVGGALAIVSLGLPSAAQAQETFTLDRAQVSGAPDDGFMVHRAYKHSETRFFANYALGYAHNPLRKDVLTDNESLRRQMEDLVQSQFLHYLVLGGEISERIGFSLHVPFAVPQLYGRNPVALGVGQAGIVDSPAAMGDLRIEADALLFETDDEKWRLGVEGAFTIPSGTEAFFGGDPGSGAMLFATGEYDFGPFFLAGHIGPHFRSQGEIGGGNGDLFIDNELRYALGGYMPLREGDIRLGLEVWGSTSIASRESELDVFDNTTVEWLAQARFLPFVFKQIYVNAGGGTRMSNGYGSADFRLMASIGVWATPEDFKPDSPPEQVRIKSRPDHYEVDTDGDGWPDGIDPCPTEKEDGKDPEPADGCPELHDKDGDGIYDRWDKCPDEPEDKDGVMDKDGCPEDDGDNDKILDKVDACPEEPGNAHPDPKINGCPTKTKLTGEGTIALLEPIEFELGSATIRPKSYGILDEVVTLLKARPEVRLAVHGHTDTIGTRDDNLLLSKARAKSVKEYLVDKGIDESRLESEGFGPDKPLASNETAEGRARNRRVEFILIEDGEDEDEEWN